MQEQKIKEFKRVLVANRGEIAISEPLTNSAYSRFVYFQKRINTRLSEQRPMRAISSILIRVL